MLQERLLRMRGDLPETWLGGLAVTCAIWVGASKAVLRAIARTDRPGLTQVPPRDSDAVAAMMDEETHRLYFNVHGSNQVAYWVGDDHSVAPPALRPGDIRVAPNAILVSEACYGARHDQDDGTPISTSFFNAGGGAFVGSTIIAFDAVEETDGAALSRGTSCPALFCIRMRSSVSPSDHGMRPLNRAYVTSPKA